jgi:hypothetical protein
MAPETDYEKLRRDREAEAVQKQLQTLSHQINRQQETLAVHVRDCMGQRQAVQSTLTGLVAAQSRQTKQLVLAIVALGGWVLGLKVPAVMEVLKAIGLSAGVGGG